MSEESTVSVVDAGFSLHESEMYLVTLSCGYLFESSIKEIPNFCPECGKRVVIDEEGK